MKWSRYNHLLECKYGHFIYNAVTNSFLKISPGLFALVKQTEDWDRQLEQLDPEFCQVLLANRIVVPNDFDARYLRKLQFVHQRSAFADSLLGLTIATTTACNFQCPYCYEGGITAQRMDEETEAAIVEYIKTIAPKRLDVTWYGGEPLMNFPTIVRLTESIGRMDFIKQRDYGIVTNGSLLTEEACRFFASCGLRSVQVTLDGTAECHDRSRKMKNGQSSYALILGNLDRAIDLLPDCHFSIRVNVSYANRSDYPVLYRELHERYRGKKNFSMYFSFVEDYGSCGESMALCSRERMAFLRELIHTHHISVRLYPRRQHALCVACHINDFVIAPNGDLYKCWSDLGRKHLVVGNIRQKKKVDNYDLVCDYAIHYNKFNDPKCLACFLFPVCAGGCPGNRYNNERKGTCLEICPYHLEYIDEVLVLMYEKVQAFSKQRKEAGNIVLK